MKETFGDLMGEYQRVREGARCHSNWKDMDAFVEKVVGLLTHKPNTLETYKLSDFRPPIISPPEQPKIGYDDMGTPVHEDK